MWRSGFVSGFFGMTWCLGLPNACVTRYLGMVMIKNKCYLRCPYIFVSAVDESINAVNVKQINPVSLWYN
jgi:hypothetical protein